MWPAVSRSMQPHSCNSSRAQGLINEWANLAAISRGHISHEWPQIDSSSPDYTTRHTPAFAYVDTIGWRNPASNTPLPVLGLPDMFYCGELAKNP